MKTSEDCSSEEDSRADKISNSLAKKNYTQKFRPNWLNIFHPWLSQDSTSLKPFCNVCNCQLHCNICHFKRHARTLKHKAHMEAYLHGGDVMELKHKLSKTSQIVKKERSSFNNKISEEIEIKCLKQPAIRRVNKNNLSSQSTHEQYQYENKNEYVKSPNKLLNKSITPDGNEKLIKSPISKDRAMLLNRIKQDRLELFDSYAAVVSQRVADINPPKRERDHVDLYFDSVSASIKRLSPKLIAEAKIRVSQMVGELELREITAKESASGVGETSYESPFSMSTGAPYYINQPSVVYVENHQNEQTNEESTMDLQPES